jgi:hypothetical protein
VKHSRLITVLTFAVMLIILAYLVASVTSCTTQPVSTVTEDGTVYHPYSVDASPYGNNDTWDVLTVKGHEKWREPETLYVLHPGDFIWYHNAKYRVLALNRSALTMSVSGALDCCAG